jgi:nucleoid-associated protein YgaU
VLRIGLAVLALVAAVASLLTLHPGPAARRGAMATAAVPAPASPTPAPNVDEVTDAILAALGLLQAPAPDQTGLQAMTRSAVQALAGAAGGPLPPDPPVTLQSLVTGALRDGKPDAEIDRLVNAAAARGDIRVPLALITADGRVDTPLLLANLVDKATREAGARRSAPPATTGAGGNTGILPGGDGAPEPQRIYTVQPGDSLGGIAVRHYGDINRFLRVYDANRTILSSPDRIRVGQRLVLPAP